jgi:hypothetical protein
MEESQMQVYKGKGSAPRMTVFGLKPREADDLNIIANESQNIKNEQYRDQVNAINDQYSAALASANNYGVPIDLTTAIVGDITVKTHSHADSITPISTYPTDIDRALSRLVVAMNGEPSLVGLPSGGDGLGSNRTEILMQSMASYGKGLRRHIEPHVNRIFLQHAARLGMRLPKYEWDWEGIDTTDVKAMAEIEKQKADTQKVWVDALTTLTQAGEIEAAANFARENDLDWFQGTEPDLL